MHIHTLAPGPNDHICHWLIIILMHNVKNNPCQALRHENNPNTAVMSKCLCCKPHLVMPWSPGAAHASSPSQTVRVWPSSRRQNPQQRARTTSLYWNPVYSVWAVCDFSNLEDLSYQDHQSLTAKWIGTKFTFNTRNHNGWSPMTDWANQI